MLDVGNTFDLNEQKWQFWVGSRAKKIPQLPWSFSPSMSFYLCHQLYWIEQSRHTGFILPCYSHIFFKVACIWILMQQQSSRGKCKGSSVFLGEKKPWLKNHSNTASISALAEHLCVLTDLLCGCSDCTHMHHSVLTSSSASSERSRC